MIKKQMKEGMRESSAVKSTPFLVPVHTGQIVTIVTPPLASTGTKHAYGALTYM